MAIVCHLDVFLAKICDKSLKNIVTRIKMILISDQKIIERVIKNIQTSITSSTYILHANIFQVRVTIVSDAQRILLRMLPVQVSAYISTTSC